MASRLHYPIFHILPLMALGLPTIKAYHKGTLILCTPHAVGPYWRRAQVAAQYTHSVSLYLAEWAMASIDVDNAVAARWHAVHGIGPEKQCFKSSRRLLPDYHLLETQASRRITRLMGHPKVSLHKHLSAGVCIVRQAKCSYTVILSEVAISATFRYHCLQRACHLVKCERMEYCKSSIMSFIYE